MEDDNAKQNLVLIADDDNLCADALESIISLLGYEVVVTHNAADTLAMIERLSKLPFALITDQHMGDGPTGQEVCQRARDKFPGLPCMVLSGDTSPGFKSLMHASGIIAAHKPTSPAAIMDFVQHAQTVWDEGRHSARELR